MTERALSPQELNRAVLARQLLLERAELGPAEAAARVAGLQTQYSPSGYVGLWSRLVGFRRAQLTDALMAGRVVQAWMMRCTIHMVAPQDYWPFTEAVREARREWWRRATRGSAEVDMPAVAAAVRGYLADGPLKQAELQGRLRADGYAKEVWPGVQLWLDLVRVPPAGTWDTPRAHVYGLAEDTVPVPDVLPAPDGAMELLAARYLHAFGPAAPGDVALFCGWPVAAARAVLARMDLRRYRTEAGAELWDVPGAPLPAADTPAPVRFLGQWDANLLVHVRRARILPEEYRPRIFARNVPQSVPTFLVDGRVAGTWRFVDGEVRWEAFQPLTDAARSEVDAEAAALSAFRSAAT